MKRCSSLREDVAHLRRLPAGHPDKSYDGHLAAINRVIEENSRDGMRLAIFGSPSKPLQQDPSTGDHQTEPALLNRVAATTGNTMANANTATIPNIATMLVRPLRLNKPKSPKDSSKKSKSQSPPPSDESSS